MSSLLAEIMFKEYRRRVLSLLLLRPEQAYHVREIARLTGTVPGTLHKELRKLAKAGILKKSSRGNQVSYQANSDCLIIEELSSILRKTSGVADVVREALTPLNEDIDVALIFGSIASGKSTSISDIDLLIVGKAGFSDVVKALYSTQELLGREINPKVYSAREWLTAREKSSAFIREILDKPSIKIIGDIDELG
ncbi:MAG: nucleotidyltransferase domain-containing protein [Proteobacteria bacterium]|nr:nucleotidyltransferase domain-containing protein [Pseudomonadota bacterium]